MSLNGGGGGGGEGSQQYRARNRRTEDRREGNVVMHVMLQKKRHMKTDKRAR